MNDRSAASANRGTQRAKSFARKEVLARFKKNGRLLEGDFEFCFARDYLARGFRGLRRGQILKRIEWHARHPDEKDGCNLVSFRHPGSRP